MNNITTAIDLIINFLKDFSNTNIRKNYNYFKHKGKPAYDEIEKLRGNRMMGLYVEKMEKELKWFQIPKM